MVAISFIWSTSAFRGAKIAVLSKVSLSRPFSIVGYLKNSVYLSGEVLGANLSEASREEKVYQGKQTL